MYTVLVVFHVIVSVFLILIILLQAGKGAEMGAAFGGSSQTVFGSRGPATFLSKMTTIVAILFLVLSVALATMTKKQNVSSVVDSVPAGEMVPVTKPAPDAAAPAVMPTVPAPVAPEKTK